MVVLFDYFNCKCLFLFSSVCFLCLFWFILQKQRHFLIFFMSKYWLGFPFLIHPGILNWCIVVYYVRVLVNASSNRFFYQACFYMYTYIIYIFSCLRATSKGLNVADGLTKELINILDMFLANR